MSEALEAVRAFVERGGDVLLAIGAVTFLMWTLILERIWYFQRIAPREAKRVQEIWEAEPEHSSWHADQIRNLLVSEVRSNLGESIGGVAVL